MSDSRAALQLSEHASLQLMNLLFDRGYFDDEKIVSMDEKRQENRSHLVPTSFGTYLTLEALALEIEQALKECGRLSLDELGTLVGVDRNQIDQSLHRIPKLSLLRVSPSYASEQTILLTESYTQQKVDELVHDLSVSTGRRLVSVLAHDDWYLPIETTLSILETHLVASAAAIIKRQHNGSHVVLTSAYMQRYHDTVLGTFTALESPVHVEQFALDRGWEPEWVMEALATGNSKRLLPGELHGDTYVPDCYVKRQKQHVRDLYMTNGFVTVDQCPAVSPLQMVAYVTDEFPDALVFAQSVVHPEILPSVIEAAIQETDDSHSWLDLQSVLPTEMLSKEEDVRALLNDRVLKDAAGTSTIAQDGAVYLSAAFLQDVHRRCVEPLIEPFVKAKALEMLDYKNDDKVHTRNKEKRKAKKTKNVHSETTVVEGYDSLVVPFRNVVDAVALAVPDFRGMDANDKDGLLHAMVRQAFYTTDFCDLCETLVRSEIDRLETERENTKRKKGTTGGKPMDTDLSFEDPQCFANACYLIQTMSQFIEYAQESSMKEDVLDLLRKDLLLGIGAEFTRRVMEYSLSKNQVDDDQFFFTVADGKESDLPSFFSPIDIAACRYDTVRLSCTADGDKRQEPLPLLRKALPATMGTALARQWVLCGGECYQGGAKSTPNGEVHTRPGDYESFLSHIEENTLSVCGLPFKKLDKKSKKQFLHSRRQRLVQRLHEKTDVRVVLDLSVMLLFQLVKNHVVFGAFLSGPILHMLIKERKISEEVAQTLSEVSDRLEAGELIEGESVDKVKACALGGSDVK